MKQILSILFFCVSLTVAQKELTSYERDYPSYPEEFPVTVQPLWKTTLQQGNCNSSTLVGEQVLVHIDKGTFYASSLLTGEILWKVDNVCTDNYQLPRVLYGDGIVYIFDIGNDGVVRAFIEKTGEELWTYSIEDTKYRSVY